MTPASAGPEIPALGTYAVTASGVHQLRVGPPMYDPKFFGFRGTIKGIASYQFGGYWLLNTNGAVYNVQASGYYGGANLGAQHRPHLSAAATAISTPHDGNGYAILDADGHVFTFGAARYHGGLTAAERAAAGPAVGLAYTGDGQGYWILTSSGDVFSFGTATYLGNLASRGYPGVPVAIAADPINGGYAIGTSSGAIYTFGHAEYLGNLIDQHIAGPLVAMTYYGG